NVSAQAPAVALALQVSPLALVLTVTLPVGVPDSAVTLKRTVTVWPMSEGSGSSAVIRVVVRTAGGADTVWPSLSLLPANRSPPGCEAVSVRDPTPVSDRLHSPAPTGALQLAPSSEVTPTVPSGEPPGDCTLNRTRTVCPGADGSGSSDWILVVVPARASVMVADVAPM